MNEIKIQMSFYIGPKQCFALFSSSPWSQTLPDVMVTFWDGVKAFIGLPQTFSESIHGGFCAVPSRRTQEAATTH